MIVKSHEAQVKRFLGVEFLLLSHGPETMITKMLFKKEDSVPFHKHPNEQSGYVISGKYRILIATDIASRGIDVTGIELVINFDLPENPEDYVHRIGRTARAGAAGRAISFATPEQKRAVRDIEGLLQTFIIISKLPELPPVPTAAVAPKSYPVHRRRNFYRRR